jgi:RNA polymerase sigma factor (sigma-70 family)
MSDPNLLRAYAERRSEAAFAELVRRHIDLVHSAALRMVNDSHLAEDVTQSVFVALAKDAGKLSGHPVLSGWLHRATRNIAAQTIRTDVRRRNREQEAAAMCEFTETKASWQEIAPHLDAAIAELNESDRDAVLLRYFENKPAQEMATILGISTEAAQKRVSRAVEKLRENFAKRGVTAGTVGLAGSISANAVQAAPAGLAATITSASLTGGLAATATTTPGILAMTIMKKAIAVTAVAALAGTAIYQFTRRPEVAKHESRMPEGSPSHDRKSREDNSVVERLAKVRNEKPPIDRRAELERLKGKWVEILARGKGGDEEKKVLAKESAELLLCSVEAVELLRFLKTDDPSNFWNNDSIIDEVSNRLASKDDPEARKLLLDAAERVLAAADKEPDFRSAISSWSKAAAQSCSATALAELRDGLKDPQFAQEALFGYNTVLMRTDPEAAVRTTVEVLQAGRMSMTTAGSISSLFSEALPPDTDFAKLEGMFPADPVSGEWQRFPGADPFENGRKALFKKWVEADPAAAANHVIAHPDRLGPEWMGDIIAAYSEKNAAGVAAWVSQFPPGPYFDAAAHRVAFYTKKDFFAGNNTPDEAKALILRIGDPKIREDALKEFNKPPVFNEETR